MYSAQFRSTFFRVLKFVEIRHGGSNFWREPIFEILWMIWSPLLYFEIKSFLDPNSATFIKFQCILYDSAVLLSGFSNLHKLKTRDLISGVSQFCRSSEVFGPSLCTSILKVSSTQILRHSFDFSPFCMNQEDFSQSSWISRNKRGSW